MRTLILSPHTDDAEFGCGGFIAKSVEQGHELFLLVFSLCEQSVPRHLPKDVLAKELYDSTNLLGIPKNHVFTESLPVRIFLEYRQHILDTMIRIRDDIKPDLVIMPSLNDTHQDHNVVSNEGFRAFKRNSILGYEMPWNNLTITTQAFCVLEEHHIEKKLAAIKCYDSQANRMYSEPDFIKGLARTRGVQCGRRYAEAFEVYRQFL
jgi:N-acetylglucosamine malate deacetylase 1